uniref:Uncharacterized protein n=1 Tax=Florenciella parvula TaxID=236787 RepID=A0A7S2GA74_9STRA|mmetsp:Transcript_7280/g.15131  ORF Transcript_7280/g.15131 Transcript_7280/m.15131 type:complete len:248 (+) Transcript_7280:1-744(+)
MALSSDTEPKVRCDFEIFCEWFADRPRRMNGSLLSGPDIPDEENKTLLDAQFEQRNGDQDVRKRLESSKRLDRRRRSKWREQKEAGAAAACIDGDRVVPSTSSTSSAPPPRQSARARTAVNKACKCMCKGLRCRRGQHCPCLDPTKAAEPDSLAEFCADCLVDRCRCDGGCVGTGLRAEKERDGLQEVSFRPLSRRGADPAFSQHDLVAQQTAGRQYRSRHACRARVLPKQVPRPARRSCVRVRRVW